MQFEIAPASLCEPEAAAAPTSAAPSGGGHELLDREEVDDVL